MDSHLHKQRNEDRREYHEHNVRDHRADRHMAGIANAQHTGPQTLQLHFAGEQLDTKVRWWWVEMVGADRKLDALTSSLTARQRALVVIRVTRAEERPDERLYRLCPPQDQQEFESILKAVDRGNTTLHSTIIFILEWLAMTELELHWLETLAGYQAREKTISATDRKGLPKLPPVWSKRTVYRGWGMDLEETEEAPKTWEAAKERLLRDVRRALQMRWQEYLQTEEVLNEAVRALGTEVAHPVLRTALDGLRDGVIGLTREMEDQGYEIALPDLDWEQETFAKGAFNLDVLREVPPEKHAREWMQAKQLEELEAWEKEQAQLLDDE